MNYFEFYELEPQFFIDENLLKKKFYDLSKKFHPDFHANKSEEEQDKILELSTINNQAFKALNNFNARLEQVLQIKGVLQNDEKYELPKDFLLEMMEINESIMDLSFEPNLEATQALQTQVKQIQEEYEQDLNALAQSYDAHKDESILLKIKDLWYRKKYLLRIQDSLNKFAT